MKSRTVEGLELIVAEPKRRRHDCPLLFVHGAFAGAWVWAERFLPYFSQRGYCAAALSLRGHGGSRGHEHIDAFGIRDFVDDIAVAIAELGQPPVLLGHSMGGFVVQKYLEHYQVPAVVLMSSVPPQGLMASTFHLVMKRPGLLLELNRLMGGGQINPESVRAALFSNEISNEQIATYNARMSIESQRAIWDMTMFNLVWPRVGRTTPMMVLGTEDDQLIPPFLVQSTARAYGVPDHLFRGFGHAFMLEPGGEKIADAVMEWLFTLDL